MSENPPEPPSQPADTGMSATKILIMTFVGVIVFTVAMWQLDARRSARDSLSQEQADVLVAVFDGYELDARLALCGSIDRPSEEAGLALFGLHFVQEVDRRGADLPGIGIPSEGALKDAATQVCGQVFGGASWWDERETRPEGDIPIGELFPD